VTIEPAISKPFCNLLHFKRDTKKRQDPRVLVVAPLSGHYATLLRDTVRAMLPDHDVYVTDWIDARMVPLDEGYFHFADYVAYVQEFIRCSARTSTSCRSASRRCRCWPPISLMAAADDPAQPRSMTLMGGPIDTRRSPTVGQQLRQDAQPALVRHPRHHSACRANIPATCGASIQASCSTWLRHAMNADRHLNAHIDFYNHLVIGDGESRRGAPQVLRRIQRRDGPAGRVLPGNAATWCS
jgi:poly(3-hydroxybutyrate) depolymerase